MKRLIFITVILMICISIEAQKMVVHGKVTAFNQLPVANIVVNASKSKASAMTDSLGQFSIECEKKDVLIFNSKAFEYYKKTVSTADSVKINLIFKEGEKYEKLAVENRYLKPEEMAYASSNLMDRNNDFYTYRNIYDLIRGKFSGVDITESGKIVIRGQTQSLTLDDSALLIVDGIETSDISNIQPGEVKSIELLKGTETSFYGMRGANGVIVIKTRAGIRD